MFLHILRKTINTLSFSHQQHVVFVQQWRISMQSLCLATNFGAKLPPVSPAGRQRTLTTRELLLFQTNEKENDIYAHDVLVIGFNIKVFSTWKSNDMCVYEIPKKTLTFDNNSTAFSCSYFLFFCRSVVALTSARKRRISRIYYRLFGELLSFTRPTAAFRAQALLLSNIYVFDK